MGVTAKYLVVEDDATCARTVARSLRKCGVVRIAPTFAEARETLERRELWTGFVFDVGLPDGCGLELLERVRTEGIDTPALVLTASREDHVLRAAAMHRATYLPKPFAPAELEAFARDAMNSNDATAALRRVVESLARQVDLSEREQNVVFLSAAGMARPAIAVELDIRATTLHTYVQRAVTKSGRESWKALIEEVQGEVFRATRDGRWRSS